ncbi:MAG TPA: hypothetical protein VMD27_14120 [Candidatus Aquilonibacter sp.]|nr:hypothetical protein [Candidatus Aquilonibacter sp.]
MLAVAVGAGFLAMNLAAQDAATTTAAPTLSPAAAQVLQLAQAKVGDDTIIAYIQNSDTIYGLNASQIVYLKQQGVSSAVINTMLNQRTRLAATGAQPDNSTATAQTSTAVAEPTVTYVQTVPSSSVYVIPDTQTYDYDTYYYQPYYYPYYAWPYPAVSLSFGFGGHWGGGYYHGGGFHGGGFHGIGRR